MIPVIEAFVLNRYNVLIVDGEEEDRIRLITGLQDAGFRTFSASGESEAFKRIHSEKPTFLILDLGLQESKGLEFLDRLRKNPPTSKLILVVLTRKQDLDLKVQLLSSGVHEVLVKPVEAREIAARLERFLAMIAEFRAFPSGSAGGRLLLPPAPEQDRSHGTVDVISPRCRRAWPSGTARGRRGTSRPR